MRTKLLSAAILLIASQASWAQSKNKDCDLFKAKDASGQISQYAKVPGKAGNFTIGKVNGKYAVWYQTKFIFDLVKEQRNALPLVIDSVRFAFKGEKPFSIKVAGKGIVVNSSASLKPYFDTVQFNFMVENEEHVKIFKNGTLIAFDVKAEKEAQWADSYNEKQQQQLRQAFICIP